MNTAGSIVAAAGLVPLILGLDIRLRRVGFVVFVVGVGMMASSLLESPLHHLRTTFGSHPAVGVAGAALGIAGLVAAAVVFRRWPWLTCWRLWPPHRPGCRSMWATPTRTCWCRSTR